MTLNRYDLSIGPAQRLSVLVMAVVWLAAMSAWWAHRPIWIGPVPLVNVGKVESVRQRIDPNVATAASLRRLRGIGPVLAGAIVDYRLGKPDEPFQRPEDLDLVPGIGPATTKRLSEHLKFPNQPDWPLESTKAIIIIPSCRDQDR